MAVHIQSAALLLALLHGSSVLSATVRHGGYSPADVRKLGATVRKIPTLFVRDPDDMKHVTSEVNPECKWVLDGEGVATRKYDGTCVMLDESGWWARREVKPGNDAPDGYRLEEIDENTGKSVGWEPMAQSPFARFHAEAVGAGGYARSFTAGTYELCGPKVNGNPERLEHHELIPHGLDTIEILTTDAATLRDEMASLAEHGWEGIVWHHPDGRMAKLKVRDFR